MSQEKKLMSRRKILSNGALAGLGVLGIGGLLTSNHLMAPTAQAAAVSATTAIEKWSITCNNSYTGTMLFPATFSHSSWLTDNGNFVYLGTVFQDALFFVNSTTDAKVSFLQLKDPSFNSFDLYFGSRGKNNKTMGGEFVQISRPYVGAAYHVSPPYDWFASWQKYGIYTFFDGNSPLYDKYEKTLTTNTNSTISAWRPISRVDSHNRNI